MSVYTLIENSLTFAGKPLVPALNAIGDLVGYIAPNYWSFLNRGFGKYNADNFTDVIYKNFWLHSIYCTIFFSSLFLFIPKLITFYASKWHDSIDDKKKKELPAYIVCMFHHVVIVPWSIKSIYDDWYHRNNDIHLFHDYRTTETSVVPILIGYLMGDLFCSAIPTMQWEYIIHHIITLYLTIQGCFAIPPYTARFIAHLLICDSTQLTFNTAWLLRLTPYQNHPIVTILELSFLCFFILFRVINMPLCFLVQMQHGAAIGMGLARFTFLPLTLMQFFWMFKVVQGVQKKMKQK
jgi:hypothetical protein